MAGNPMTNPSPDSFKETEITYSGEKEGDHASILRVRLDTNPVLNDIKEFLTGKRYFIVTNEQGEQEVRIEHLSEALCNEIGVSDIMRDLKMLIQPHLAMGNYSWEYYIYNVAQFEGDFAAQVIANKYRWQINDFEKDQIIITILQLVRAYFSRTINDKERIHISTGQFQVRENVIQSNTPQVQNKRFGLLG